jgi:hypothetical protein
MMIGDGLKDFLKGLAIGLAGGAVVLCLWLAFQGLR